MLGVCVCVKGFVLFYFYFRIEWREFLNVSLQGIKPFEVEKNVDSTKHIQTHHKCAHTTTSLICSCHIFKMNTRVMWNEWGEKEKKICPKIVAVIDVQINSMWFTVCVLYI